MANNDKRLSYFNGQFLQDTDFKTEQAYHIDRRQRHNRLMHTYGIAEGLAVSALPGASTVGVTPGTAIDGQGRQIVLFDPRTLQLGAQSPFSGKTVLVVVAYAEAPSDPAQVGGSGNTRTWENPDVKLVVDDGTAPAPDASLRLARLKVDSGGLVSGNPDLSVRVTAGARVGSEVDVPLLKLATPGVDASQWPAFTSNAAGEADLAGSLVVSGDIKVGSATQTVAAHLADKTNPHGTTAAQVGAITGIGGVTNPGGTIGVIASGGVSVSPDTVNKRLSFLSNAPASISGVTNPGADIAMAAGNTGLAIVGDPTNRRVLFTPHAPSTLAVVANPAGDIGLAAGGAIVITPDNSSNKRITISENHSTTTNNPHLTTATQVGAIIGVGGVTNPGGQVNLATGGAITVTADNTSNKRITISETHSALTGNPHGTTAAQVGALALTDYDIGQRTLTSFSFSNADVDGATKTINLNFKAHLVWVSGYATANLNGNSCGGAINGFQRLDGGIGGYAFGPYLQRNGAPPYTSVLPSVVSTNSLARAYFYDNSTATVLQVDLTITISSVTATGLVVTFNKTTTSPNVAPSSFVIYAALLCLGA